MGMSLFVVVCCTAKTNWKIEFLLFKILLFLNSSFWWCFYYFFYSTDCEKTIDNEPTNVYNESMCGTDLSDYLGNQRLAPNSMTQDFSTEKNYSVQHQQSGEYLLPWFDILFYSIFIPVRLLIVTRDFFIFFFELSRVTIGNKTI